jgi:GT2 family glycosyltransferase
VGWPKVAIVVLNRNGLKWLPKCLSSIRRTCGLNFDLYLVDNASTDGSVRYVREHFPTVKIISHSKNLGFAAGYNRALKAIKADYVVLLNNDTEVLSPHWVQSLVQAAAEGPRVAAVACKMVSMENPERLDSVGAMGIPFWRGFVDIGREERDRGQYDTSFEPFSFCGGAALVNHALFEQVGGFDEEFFIYLEDIDLSWRLRLLRYQVGFAPEAKVAHFSSGLTGTKFVDAWKLYLSHRNLLRTILKNCGSSLGWALRDYLLFSLIVGVGFSVLEPRKGVAIMRAILWNLSNFRDTYTLRLAIQTRRKTNETEILVKMYPKIRRHQPAEHITLRRILNILFEHSQSISGLR